MEEWIRYDGKQIARYDDGRLRISDVPPDPGDDDLSPQRYAEKLRELPTDPDKLLAHVRGDRHWIDLPVEEGATGAREDPDARAFRVISVYLGQQAIMPPKLEAAMYRALGKIPGVGVEVSVEDAAGRKGLGVFRDAGGLDTRQYLILEPETFRYLGMRVLWLRDEMSGSSTCCSGREASTPPPSWPRASWRRPGSAGTTGRWASDGFPPAGSVSRCARCHHGDGDAWRRRGSPLGDVATGVAPRRLADSEPGSRRKPFAQ